MESCSSMLNAATIKRNKFSWKTPSLFFFIFFYKYSFHSLNNLRGCWVQIILIKEKWKIKEMRYLCLLESSIWQIRASLLMCVHNFLLVFQLISLTNICFFIDVCPHFFIGFVTSNSHAHSVSLGPETSPLTPFL